MKRFTFDPATMNGWKSYPIRFEAAGLSRCHGKPRLLVQSQDGGYVTANCSQCNEKDFLSELEFKQLTKWLWVSCPNCRKKMAPSVGRDGSKNYGLKCEVCGIFIWLSDLLPHWEHSV